MNQTNYKDQKELKNIIIESFKEKYVDLIKREKSNIEFIFKEKNFLSPKLISEVNDKFYYFKSYGIIDEKIYILLLSL